VVVVSCLVRGGSGVVCNRHKTALDSYVAMLCKSSVIFLFYSASFSVPALSRRYLWRGSIPGLLASRSIPIKENESSVF